METFDIINQLCRERGIKLSTLAEVTKISSSVFTELKKGRTKKLSVSTLQKLADYFEVPVTYFTDGESVSVNSKQEELFNKRKLLFDMSGRASADDLDTIIKIVDALIND